MRKAELVVAFALASCAEATAPEPGSGDAHAVDILFVVRDSSTMADEQAALVAMAPGFIAGLDATDLDYRIGVTTTGRTFAADLATPFGTEHVGQQGANGMLVNPCATSHPWIEAAEGSTLACAVNVGTAGPLYEMPLGAIRDAFTEPKNPGFHRPGAVVGMIVVSDGDDCSYEHSVSLDGTQTLCVSLVEPVATYVSFVTQLPGATVVIANPGPTACQSALGPADPASRLVAFASGTGGAVSSICDGDLTTGLAQAIDALVAATR